MGQGLRRASHSQARRVYWAGSKVSPSSPSSSTPTESLLQLLRPRQHDTPACQARSNTLTYCVSPPCLSMKKCADTSSPRMAWK